MKVYETKRDFLTANVEEIPPVFYDDMYVVDVSRGSVIVGRGMSARLVSGNDIRDLITPSESEALRRYLISFDKRPMILRTDVGVALIYADLFPHTLMFPVFFVHTEKELEISEMATLSRRFDLFLPSIYSAQSEELSRATEKAFERSINEAAGFLNNDSFSDVMLGRTSAAEALKLSIVNASRVTGCPVDLESEDGLWLNDEFDVSLFKAFLLLFLLSARMYSIQRRAKVRLKRGFEGIMVSAEATVVEEKLYKMMYAISAISDLSERHNTIYRTSLIDGRFEVTFCPVRKDWSRLGIKSPIGFDWKDKNND